MEFVRQVLHMIAVMTMGRKLHSPSEVCARRPWTNAVVRRERCQACSRKLKL